MSPYGEDFTEDFTGFAQSSFALYRGQIVRPLPSGNPMAIRPSLCKLEIHLWIVRGDTLNRLASRQFQQ